MMRAALLVLCVLPWFGTAAGQQPERTIAVTVDDLPSPERLDDLAHLQAINRDLLKALADEHVPAIGFVNEAKLLRLGEVDARIAILEQWLAAGMELGNHTFSHKGLTRTPLPQWEDEVMKGEAITRRLLEASGGTLRYLRHPFGQAGPKAEVKEASEQFLHSRGYTIAPFTVENSDWMFARAYLHMIEKGDAARAQQVRYEYLEYLTRVLEFDERLSRETFGREPAQILLIHVNRLNADLMPEVLALLKARGYRFIPLQKALEDRVYQTADGYVGPHGPSWLHRWRITLKQPDRTREEPKVPRWIVDLDAALTARPAR